MSVAPRQLAAFVTSASPAGSIAPVSSGYPIVNEKGLVRTACEAAIARQAVKVSVVVGTVLNVLNQGPALMDGRPLAISQLLLNYLVPYLVSSYSAACNEMNRRKMSLANPSLGESARSTINE